MRYFKLSLTICTIRCLTPAACQGRGKKKKRGEKSLLEDPFRKHVTVHKSSPHHAGRTR